MSFCFPPAVERPLVFKVLQPGRFVVYDHQLWRIDVSTGWCDRACLQCSAQCSSGWASTFCSLTCQTVWYGSRAAPGWLRYRHDTDNSSGWSSPLSPPSTGVGNASTTAPSTGRSSATVDSLHSQAERLATPNDLVPFASATHPPPRPKSFNPWLDNALANASAAMPAIPPPPKWSAPGTACATATAPAPSNFVIAGAIPFAKVKPPDLDRYLRPSRWNVEEVRWAKWVKKVLDKHYNHSQTQALQYGIIHRLELSGLTSFQN